MVNTCDCSQIKSILNETVNFSGEERNQSTIHQRHGYSRTRGAYSLTVDRLPSDSEDYQSFDFDPGKIAAVAEGAMLRGSLDSALVHGDYDDEAVVDEQKNLQFSQRVVLNTDPSQELVALPQVREMLEVILQYFESPAVIEACQRSQAVGILRGRLLTSLFHLNFKPEISEKNVPEYHFLETNYPYDPVYDHPFPKRPSLEVLDEAMRLAVLLEKHAEELFEGFEVEEQKSRALDIISEIRSFEPFEEFRRLLEIDRPRLQEVPVCISREEMKAVPVDSYFTMRKRLVDHGEVASFPEFADAVQQSLVSLYSDEISEMAAENPIFKDLVDDAVEELTIVSGPEGEPTFTQKGFYAHYPYRRTICAIRQAVAVFEMKERLRYPEGNNWYEVEESWNPQEGEKEPKLLPLYHFNRYKYQEFGLLANPNVIILPWFGDATMEDLIRLRPVPISLVGVTPETIRADRHYNSPLDFWYHDLNHIRRMWGYDKRRIQGQGLTSWRQLELDMRLRQSFLEDLLEKTNPEDPDITLEEKQIRVLERFIIFETVHETALSASRESLLNDLLRGPATRQPFEVQIQGEEYFKEKNRQFDGNLKSGADVLELGFANPTTIEYFFDRAPGFLSNVYNKLAWGFYESVFVERKDPDIVRYRTPERFADATISLFHKLGFPHERIPAKEVLIEEIMDRSGQPELYNYFALHEEEDLSEEIRAQLGRGSAQDILRPEILAARELKAQNSGLTPVEIAQRVMTTGEHKEIIKWMSEDLERYQANFDEYFNAKLERSSSRSFVNAEDFINQFVGRERGKLLKTECTEEELSTLEKGGTLYVDTWDVPFFNTATQTREEALENIIETVRLFKSIDLDSDISMYQFAELLARYARPEFNDVRRYKLQLFPTDESIRMYGNERSDAKAIGDRYPDEAFIVTNQELSLDDLSFTFGRRIHYLGLIPQSETIRADGRVFVGTCDFLEHDESHGYFNLHPSVPGEAEEWVHIHEDFRSIQAQISDPKKRLMNSLIYFHFTHESAYKTLIPDEEGNAPDPEAYKNEFDIIIERMETENDYDFFKLPENFGEDYLPLLQESFEEITTFFKGCIERVQV